MRIGARRTLGFLSLFLGIGILISAFTYATGNTDFWWHIKAGEIMRTTGQWITTDPFAWTRNGLPYLATHEWLAQIFLSLAWDTGGAYGVIALRIVLLAACVFLPLLIERKKIWMTAPVAVIAAIGLRGGITDRPQLFTFIAFSAVVTCCALYPEVSAAMRRNIRIALPVIIAVWANLHGGAAMAGIAVIGCLGVQSLFMMFAGRCSHREIGWLLASGVAACIALFITPGGIHVITYVSSLFSDKTAEFISEWQPSSTADFLKNTGPMLFIALTSTFFIRSNGLFSISLIAVLTVLARSASRHEPLLVIGCLAVTVLQWRNSVKIGFVDQIALRRPLAAGLSLAIIMTGVFLYGSERSLAFSRRDHLADMAVFAPASGAAAFMMKNELTGKLFNNYNAGGELLYHNIPVFLDGRNIDYGFEYIRAAVNAGVDRNLWSKLDAKYGFGSAAIEYYLQAESDPIPYVDMLGTDPAWALVYLDDWTAVYAKATPGHRAVIESHGISQITPRMLRSLTLPEAIRADDLSRLEAELLRMTKERSDAVYPHLYLAKLYASLAHAAAAEAHMDAAKKLQPSNSVVWQTDALTMVEENKFAEAGASFERAIALSGGEGVQVNFAALADIFRKAGNMQKAAYYEKKAGK